MICLTPLLISGLAVCTLYSCTPTLLHSYTPSYWKLIKERTGTALSVRECRRVKTVSSMSRPSNCPAPPHWGGQWWGMSRQHKDVSNVVVRTECLTLNSLWRILRGEWKGGVMLVLDSVGGISGQPAGPTQIFRLEILWRVNWCFVTCHISFCFTPAT